MACYRAGKTQALWTCGATFSAGYGAMLYNTGTSGWIAYDAEL